MSKSPKSLIKKLSNKSARNYDCGEINAIVSDFVTSRCEDNHNVMSSPGTDAESNCGCSDGAADKGKVDLVVLIDSSSTMRNTVLQVSDAAPAAIEAIAKTCGADLQVKWFWVDAVKPGSSNSNDLWSGTGVFTQSHQKYLEGIGATGPFFHDVMNASLAGYAAYEQGADAIADISQFFDWREDACRSVFYISDTLLEGYGSNEIQNDVAVMQAISVANTNNVTVFAHRADPLTFSSGLTAAQVDNDYINLCTGTGGVATTGGQPSQALYEQLLTDAVCACGGELCQELGIPDIEPCISISWGASNCDCMESHDDEVGCITICNCYSDVSFKNISLGYVIIKDENGDMPPLLPDGTPSSYIYPTGPICFGDIAGCTDEGENCVSREFVILNRGAKPGKYQVELGYLCFDIVKHSETKQIFKTFEICQD